MNPVINKTLINSASLRLCPLITITMITSISFSSPKAKRLNRTIIFLIPIWETSAPVTMITLRKKIKTFNKILKAKTNQTQNQLLIVANFKTTKLNCKFKTVKTN